MYVQICVSLYIHIGMYIYMCNIKKKSKGHNMTKIFSDKNLRLGT